MTQSPSERVVDAFRRRFGVPPSVVASAPGRVNIVGEHVDYAGGVVLPMPIAERTAVAMSGIRDGQAAASERARSIAGTHGCEVESLDLEAFESAPAPARFEALPSDSPCAWLNAAIGPLRQLVEAGIAVPAVRAVIASDVPIGAGLSSSA
ncbi:MAG: hypothetical protein FJ253_02120, partial [Phycisphaerae bacterium]|nr:hypothetical protein [Phycisphaerae bacterium]